MINLWGLFKCRAEHLLGIPGVTGADSGAHNAWDIATGSRASMLSPSSTSGIDYTHPDLAAEYLDRATAPSPWWVGGIPITCPAGSHGFKCNHQLVQPDGRQRPWHARRRDDWGGRQRRFRGRRRELGGQMIAMKFLAADGSADVGCGQGDRVRDPGEGGARRGCERPHPLEQLGRRRRVPVAGESDRRGEQRQHAVRGRRRQRGQSLHR